MTFRQWRQYPFFDVVPVKDAHDLQSTPDIFKVETFSCSFYLCNLSSYDTLQATLEISTVASSTVGVLVADIYGSIHLLSREFVSVASWVAHVGGRVTHMVERRGILVTLGVRTFFTIQDDFRHLTKYMNRTRTPFDHHCSKYGTLSTGTKRPGHPLFSAPPKSSKVIDHIQ